MSFTEDLSNIECPHCKNEFECIVDVDYTYSTYKKEEDNE